jgi:hypothetical protein
MPDPRRAILSLVFGLTVVAGPFLDAQQDAWTGVSRIVAVGDVHGDYEQFVLVLRSAGIIDRRDRWTGGRAHLVQTGDVLDRGPASRKVMDLLMRLEKQAASDGGRVHALMGNHEAMNLYGDLRYVSAEEYAAFATRNSDEVRRAFFERYREALKASAPPEGLPPPDDLRAKFEAQYPLGFVEHRAAFSREGQYGRWLRDKNAVVKINDTLFLHGGIAPKFAGQTISQINEAVRKEIDVLTKTGPPTVLEGYASTDPEGPLWYRGLASDEEAALDGHVAAALQAFGVRRIVIGHTPTDGAVLPRFGGRVVLIDVGLSAAYGGSPACLIIEGEKAYGLHRGARLELPASGGAALLDYLKKAASLDPQPSRLRKTIDELEKRLLAPAA